MKRRKRTMLLRSAFSLSWLKAELKLGLLGLGFSCCRRREPTGDFWIVRKLCKAERAALAGTALNQVD